VSGTIGTPKDPPGPRPTRGPFFSIVTPSLNQAQFLGDALASVRGQRLPAYEHIIIDGGSADGTLGILQDASSNVRYVVEPDEGQSDALNKGLQMTSGTIIGWLNADDFYLPGAFHAVEEYFASNPDVQVVYGDAVVVDASGRVIRGLQQHGFDARILLYYGCFIPSTSTFFRSELIDTGLLHFDTTLHFTMDLELFLRLAAAGVRFGHMRRDLAACRWHPQAKGQVDSRPGIAERRRVEKQYGAMGTDGLAQKALYRSFQAAHGLRKVLAGSYWRQLRWSRARGTSLL